MTHPTDDPKYSMYLQDQVADNNVTNLRDVIFGYMKHLTVELMPSFDYRTARVLDVGARSFDTWDYFLEKYDNRIVGIDVGREGLDYCEEHGKTGMLELDAHRMDDVFPPHSFNLVLAFHSFEHMFDLPHVLRQIYRVLQPGGWLYFALPMPSFNWKRGHWYDVPSVGVMTQMCRDAGLRSIRSTCYLSDLRYRPEPEMIGLVGSDPLVNVRASAAGKDFE